MSAASSIQLETIGLGLDVQIARTVSEFDAVLAVRKQVFLHEQHLVDSAVADAEDERSIHIYAASIGGVVSVGRLTPPGAGRPDAQVAWVATLPRYRGRGAATAVMDSILDVADRARYPVILLSAQVHALGFYCRLGFAPYGDRFRVRGIEHQYMERRRRT